MLFFVFREYKELGLVLNGDFTSIYFTAQNQQSSLFQGFMHFPRQVMLYHSLEDDIYSSQTYPTVTFPTAMMTVTNGHTSLHSL